MAYTNRRTLHNKPRIYVPSRRSIWAVSLGFMLLVGGAILILRLFDSGTQAIVPEHRYDLTEAHKGEWLPYAGEWSIANGLIESGHTNSRGAKIMAGSVLWADYTVQSDIRFKDERGDIGVILRSRDEDVGIDAYNGYYVALRMDGGGVLIIGRSNYGWVEARPVQIPGGLNATDWYRLRITAVGCSIAAQVQDLTTFRTANMAFEQPKCLRTGRIGLRSVDVGGFWRNVNVSPATQADYIALEKFSQGVEHPIVLSGPPWWTPWHVAELLSVALFVVLVVQIVVYKLQQWQSNRIMRERERFAHDIHDTMAQSFAGLGYHIQGIRQVVVRSEVQDPEYIAQQLSVAYQLIRRCHSEASQTIAMLGAPSPLLQEDLVEQLAAAARAIAGNTISVQTAVSGSLIPIKLRVLDAMHHLGKEAIANAISHSGLTNLRVEVNYTSNTVELRIIDNGRGFDRVSKTLGFGIVGMRKRARDAGGVLTITSQENIGTEVHFLLNVQRDTWVTRCLTVLRASSEPSKSS